ncbi:CDGSH iron-sulfur domain-containing protein [Legionella erythra]|uniref:Glutamate synthetase n=1 Tax=Legionella erythra TaxID=448 RepID=A0A0W0TJF5_LEGER|nr:CDGSH iron-sulfur domain-containing protein [Legionella erythra]KTC95704.1 glutamate synthetase [Legionella erythra]
MSRQPDDPPFYPIACEVEKGKTYDWCSCGKSKTQPFCDVTPCEKAVKYRALITETVCFCQCKQTKEPPFCDGSHAPLLIEFMKNRKKD